MSNHKHTYTHTHTRTHTHTSIFCFNDEKRGKIKFEGNILFTHFGEIGAPSAVGLQTAAYRPPAASFNTGAGDVTLSKM